MEQDDKKRKDLEMKEKEVIEEEKRIEKDNLKNDLKMGDSSHNEDNWSWGEGDADWDGTADKREREQKKKIKRYRMRKMREEKTAKKAMHMIGLGPISLASVEYFNEITADHDSARRWQLKNFCPNSYNSVMRKLKNLIFLKQ